MNLLKTFVLFSALILIANCNNTSSNNNNNNDITNPQDLPSGITKIELQATDGVIGDFVTIDLSSSPFTGTAQFGSADKPATETCHLTLNLTSAQSTDLSNLLAATTYCSKSTCSQSSGDTNFITITSSSGTLVVAKSSTWVVGVCSNNNFDYFCPAATALYTLIEDIVQANSGFSACPSEWQFMFE